MIDQPFSNSWFNIILTDSRRTKNYGMQVIKVLVFDCVALQTISILVFKPKIDTCTHGGGRGSDLMHAE